MSRVLMSPTKDYGGGREDMSRDLGIQIVGLKITYQFIGSPDIQK